MFYRLFQIDRCGHWEPLVIICGYHAAYRRRAEFTERYRWHGGIWFHIEPHYED